MMCMKCVFKRVWVPFVVSVVVLGVLAAGVFAWWCWGWRVGGLSFHESWSPEQCADLQGMCDENKGFAASVLDMIYAFESSVERLENPDAEPKAPGVCARAWRYVVTSAEVRSLCVETDDMLHRAAATGRADIYHEDDGFSVALHAVRCGKVQLVKELVRRGADPNASIQCAPGCEQRESLLQSAIACASFLPSVEELPPLAERLELLGWLLEHGADMGACAVQGENDVTLVIATLAAMRENDKLPAEARGVLLEWLIEHGLQVDSRRYAEILGTYFSYCSEVVVRRVAAKLRLHELEDTYKALILRAMLRLHSCDMQEDTLWAFEVLGADPNLILTHECSGGGAPADAAPECCGDCCGG